MLSVHSFEDGFRDGDGHFVLKAVDNDSLCCKKNNNNNNKKPYISRVKNISLVMKAGKMMKAMALQFILRAPSR